MNTFASTIDRIDRVGASSAVWQSTAREAYASSSIWEKLKGIFSTPVRSVENLINARENFKAFLEQHVQVLGKSVSMERRDGLIAEGQGLMQQILKNSLDPLMEAAISRGDGKVGEAGLREAIGLAHKRAELALMQLQSSAIRARIAEAPAPDMRPQMIVGSNQSIRVLRPAPSIENLVLRGGGAKGIANAAALSEMESAGMLAGLRRIVGTSVGGLTAISLASGHGVKALSELTEKLSMWELARKPENFEKRYPGMDTDCRVGFHAGRTLELLDEVSAGSVASYLNKHWEEKEFQKKLAALRISQGDASVVRLNTLRTQDFNADRTSQMVTFNDLALMHSLDPATFKHLVLTGWDLKSKRMSYFEHENTPHMPIAVAGRISMSVPVMFKSVTYDPGDSGGTRTFVDGGVGSNVSTEVVFDGLQGRDLIEARVRTMVMTFDMWGEAYTIMHEPSRKRNPFWDWILGKGSGNPGYGEAGKADDEKVRGAGPNTFVVFHGDIRTIDLSASEEMVEKARLQSSLKALEQIEQRQGQAYMEECLSVEDCFAMLTEAEKLALRQGGAPSPSIYPLGVSDPAYRLQTQLYELSLPNSGKWSNPVAMQAIKVPQAEVQSVDSNCFAAPGDVLEPEISPHQISLKTPDSNFMTRSVAHLDGSDPESRSSQVQEHEILIPVGAEQLVPEHGVALKGASYNVRNLLDLLEAEKIALATQKGESLSLGVSNDFLLPMQLLRASSSISVEA